MKPIKQVKQAEDKLERLYKNAPNISSGGKNSLVSAWPWVALVFGLLQLRSAWRLYDLTTAETFTPPNNIYPYASEQAALSSGQRQVIYLAIITLIISGVIMLLAFSPLKEKLRRGWDLVFLGALLNALYALVALFINARGLGTLFFSLIGSAIAFYLLFQVKSRYSKKHS